MPRIHDESDGAFSRVEVDYSVKGESRIEWALKSTFHDPLPHRFQLQVNRNWAEPGDWQNVGLLGTNNCYAIDDTPRQFGRVLRIAYRVVMTTPCGTYTSDSAEVLGKLSTRQWLQARAIIRRYLLQPTGLEIYPGYLMKRKIHGTPCSSCVDPYTGGIIKSDCATCHGTGVVAGYWQAADNMLYDFSPEMRRSKREQQRGTVNELVASAKAIAIPLWHARDVWIDGNSDRRYIVQNVRHLAEISMVPVVAEIELRLAQLDDPVYNVGINGS